MHGYAMAALIIGIAVMAVMMTVVMPVWKQMVQREKEEELVFRGEQIAHSIGMFQRKFANAYPPTLDVLVEQKFLRKKYKDPITNEDFVPLTQAQGQAAATPGGQATRRARSAADAARAGRPGDESVRWRRNARSRRGGNYRSNEQKHRRLHPALQRTLALQRMGVCVHRSGWRRRRWRGRGGQAEPADGDSEDRASEDRARIRSRTRRRSPAPAVLPDVVTGAGRSVQVGLADAAEVAARHSPSQLVQAADDNLTPS